MVIPACTMIHVQDTPLPKKEKSPSEEIVQNVHDMVLDNQKIKQCEIVEAKGISKCSVLHILTEVTGMKVVVSKMDTVIC